MVNLFLFTFFNDYFPEVEGKDTVALDVLKRTFTPKLCLVEDEIAEEMGLKSDPRERKPTYWY